VALTREDKRQLVRPVAEVLPTGLRFRIIAVIVLLFAAAISYTALDFWPATSCVGLSVLLLLLHRLGLGHPMLERRMDHADPASKDS
jgi:hypothetical protein